MKTAERGKIQEIEMEGATIKGTAPLSQEQRSATNWTRDADDGQVFLETFVVGDQEIVLLRGSDLRNLSGIPGVKGFNTYRSQDLDAARMVGGPGEGRRWSEVPEESFVNEAYARRRNQELPPAPPKFYYPEINGRNVQAENPEWRSWYNKHVKNNPAHRSTQGSDGAASLYTPHVNVGGGMHFIPGVTVDDKPVYFFDDGGDFADKRSLGQRVRRFQRPESYYPNQYQAELAQMRELAQQADAVSFYDRETGRVKDTLVIDGVERKTADLSDEDYRNEKYRRGAESVRLNRLSSDLADKLNRYSYGFQMGEYRPSELKPEMRPRATGADIAEAYKRASAGVSEVAPEPAPTKPAPAPEPTPEPPSSFQGFEMPVVDTLKGRRRQAKRRFAERQELADE